jgi:hypothetical protein
MELKKVPQCSLRDSAAIRHREMLLEDHTAQTLGDANGFRLTVHLDD